jgi:L-lactate dehydrogenase complex protein LldG
VSARDEILRAVRSNRPEGEYPLPAPASFPSPASDDLIKRFLRNLEAMGGRGYREPEAEAWFQAHFPNAKTIASVVPEMTGNLELSSARDPRSLSDIDVACVRERFGIAETGSVLLTDDALQVNTLGYLPQHLVVLLDVSPIVPGLQEAYLRPEFLTHAYASFHTGPSATADIEGVLIHGAQGIRSLSVWLTAARA